MKLALFGTGSFAVPPFRTLIASKYDIAAVYTQPDRTGRGHHQHINPVKVLAEENGIPVFQPERVNHPEVLDDLKTLNADAFIVAAYGQILKPEFLAIPRLGAFNLHGSLLPRHRGAAPVQYSIWKGDEQTGVTIFQIEPALDSGPIVGKVVTPIDSKETSGELMERLAQLSGPLTLDVLTQLEAGTAPFEQQDSSLVTVAPKIRKEDGIIDWNQSAAEIDCHVRAMQPWPKASTNLLTNDTSLPCIVFDTEPLSESFSQKPGTVIEAGKRLVVATGFGSLQIHHIQPQGKRAMDAASFANGYRVLVGSIFRQPE